MLTQIKNLPVILAIIIGATIIVSSYIIVNLPKGEYRSSDGSLITTQPSESPISGIFQPVCGNDKCESGESSNNCCQDCGCEGGHYCEQNTCKPKCGDNICVNEENSNNCCLDCGCLSGQTCQNNICVELKPEIEVNFQQSIYPSSATYLKAKGDDIGTLYLTNAGNDMAKDIQIKIASPSNYFSDKTINIGSLSVGSSAQEKVGLVFLDEMLDIVSDSKISLNFEIEYYNSANKKYTKSESFEINVRGRNYFSWAYPNMVSSWVTPNQPSVREFASRATGGLATYASSTEQMLAARWLFETMRAYGVQYTTDAHVSGDYVQFPIETLINKGGDCEDNAILFSSLLESIGIESRVILVSGHAYSAYINKEGKLVPIETTASNFDSAFWGKDGGYTIQEFITLKEPIAIINPSEQWINYPQVPLPEKIELSMPYITKEKGSCELKLSLTLGVYASLPIRFTNSGNAPGAGCAAVTTYDNNRNKIDEDLSCWTVNPDESKNVDYIVDLSISNLFEGYYCRGV
jgi:hypothetical protein